MQDEEYRCDSFDLTSSSVVIEDISIMEIQSNYDASDSGPDDEACFPTAFPPDTVVKTTGVVTAVGRTSPPIFYMQDGNGPHSGIAVWDESHGARTTAPHLRRPPSRPPAFARRADTLRPRRDAQSAA